MKKYYWMCDICFNNISVLDAITRYPAFYSLLTNILHRGYKRLSPNGFYFLADDELVTFIFLTTGYRPVELSATVVENLNTIGMHQYYMSNSDPFHKLILKSLNF